jgi:hypothetical protein
MRRLVERGAPQLVMAAFAGEQEMTYAPAILSCFSCWRADTGLLLAICGRAPGVSE